VPGREFCLALAAVVISASNTSSIWRFIPEKALPDEAASVSRLGTKYIHIPVDFQNPTEPDFQQFSAVMEELKDVPVHVHCISNYRVSAFFYPSSIVITGMCSA